MMDELFSLSGRVAVVTGASGLLGRHHARALAEAGAHVVVTDVDAEAVRAQADELAHAYDRPMLGVAADITQPESVLALRDQALRAFARLDVLVNNAAINDKFESPQSAARQSMVESYPLELWKRSLEVNVTGTFLTSQVLGGHMAAAGSGSIINVASTYGLVAPDQSLYLRPDGTQPFYKSPAYPTSKGAVIALTKHLATYWGRAGVRVNALCPGGVENGQEQFFVEAYARRTPLGRMSAATDYLGSVVFLASDASSYMTGATLVVDGGWTAW
jgi:NAD(P)-dependent dehydrogenase (short-subunit alcohol dehydrogenase family)